MTDSDKLWKWHQDVVYGKVVRKEVHILMLKERSDDVAYAWGFKDAFPVKWTGPELKAEGSTVAFERSRTSAPPSEENFSPSTTRPTT